MSQLAMAGRCPGQRSGGWRPPLLAALALAAGVLLGSAAVGYAQTVIDVDNPSFEDPSVEITTTWHSLPVGGAWTDGNPGAIYELLNMAGESTHFNIDVGAEGTGQWVLNLGATVPMTQDLNHDVNVGDAITVSFYVGDKTAGRLITDYDPPAPCGLRRDRVDIVPTRVHRYARLCEQA